MTKPIVPMGDPTSTTCRHCESPKLKVRGFLVCEACDAGMVEGRTIRPTWKPRRP